MNSCISEGLAGIEESFNRLIISHKRLRKSHDSLLAAARQVLNGNGTALEAMRILVDKNDSSLAQDPLRRPENDVLTKSVDILELSVRAKNALLDNKILTIGKLVKTSETVLLRTPRCGQVSVNEIKEALCKLGLALGQTETCPYCGWAGNGNF